MFSTFRTMAIGAAALALAQFASPAQAAYIVTLEQVGANVVATGSGSLDTAALGMLTPPPGFIFVDQNSINASVGYIHLNDVTETVTLFGGVSGQSSFGGGGSFTASSATNGKAVDIQGNFNGAPVLSVPVGYVSGTPLGTSTITFNGSTLAALGVIPGFYTWHWGTGTTADSFTLEIGVVPEPASLTLLAMGLAGLGLVLRTRRASALLGGRLPSPASPTTAGWLPNRSHEKMLVS
jgi:hypothetical protein